jgi:hypothetical protein
MSVEAASSVEAPAETTEPDDIDVGLIATIAIVGALLVIAIAAALTALVRSESSAYGLETGSYANLGTVRRLKAEQRAKLTGPIAWGDKAKGQVLLPIDRAMDLVQTDIARDPYLATMTPPPGAAPAASAAPTDSAAPAPATAAPEKEKPGPGGKHNAPPGGKVDPAHGAPVTPAAAQK